MTTTEQAPTARGPLPGRSAALSPSRAADFMQCPLLYRFRVVDRLTAAPSPAAARGTLVHAVLERLFDLPAPERTPEAAGGLVEAEWQRLVAQEPALATLLESTDSIDGTDGTDDTDDTDEVAGHGRPTAASWFADATALVETWFTLEDPRRLEPRERELYVEVPIEGLTLRGIVDRLDVAPDGAMRVVDYKTGRSPGERYERKALFQMRFYALALWRLHGVVPRVLQLVYLGDREILRYSPDEDDLLATERLVQALWEAITLAGETGDWRPRRSRACSWCDFKALCPEWGGTPPPLPPPSAPDPQDGAPAGEAQP